MTAQAACLGESLGESAAPGFLWVLVAAGRLRRYLLRIEAEAWEEQLRGATRYYKTAETAGAGLLWGAEPNGGGAAIPG